MSNRSPYDVPAANECSDCKGQGYTYESAQIGRVTPAGYETVQLGHGCLECLGTGRIVEEK